MIYHVSTSILNFQWDNESLQKNVDQSTTKPESSVYLQAKRNPNYLPGIFLKYTSPLDTVTTGNAETQKFLTFVIFYSPPSDWLL